MSDKIYKKQLEKFGIESTLISEENPIRVPQENLSVVKTLMENMDGRKWIYSKLDMCGIFTAPWAGEKPITNAFLSGVQAVGQNLLDDVIKASPNNFSLMIQEAAAYVQKEN